MLTEKQHQIIHALQAEFDRINQSAQQRSSFNLIDINALNTKTREMKAFNESVDETNKRWSDAAKYEADKIAEMLRQDLPDAVVDTDPNYGSYIRIRHKSNANSTDIGSMVTIDVKVKLTYTSDPYGNQYPIGSYLFCEPFPMTTGSHYKTIEEAVNDERFLEALRKRVINVNN